jgi:hypothetical protein
MAKSIIEALEMFQKVGFKDVTGMSLDNNEITYHEINHRYKDEVIVPLIGVTDNVSWIMSKGQKIITCADGTQAKVNEWETKHICILEDDIKRIYGIDTWSFIKRWYASEKRMDSMTFIKMKLEKI